MEEQLIKCLKHFATSIALAEDEVMTASEAVECFLQQAELALSESGKQSLIQHIKQLWN